MPSSGGRFDAHLQPCSARDRFNRGSDGVQVFGGHDTEVCESESNISALENRHYNREQAVQSESKTSLNPQFLDSAERLWHPEKRYS
jgi:hypothetical protein